MTLARERPAGVSRNDERNRADNASLELAEQGAERVPILGGSPERQRPSQRRARQGAARDHELVVLDRRPITCARGLRVGVDRSKPVEREAGSDGLGDCCQLETVGATRPKKARRPPTADTKTGARVRAAPGRPSRPRARAARARPRDRPRRRRQPEHGDRRSSSHTRSPPSHQRRRRYASRNQREA